MVGGLSSQSLKRAFRQFTVTPMRILRPDMVAKYKFVAYGRKKVWNNGRDGGFARQKSTSLMKNNTRNNLTIYQQEKAISRLAIFLLNIMKR